MREIYNEEIRNSNLKICNQCMKRNAKTTVFAEFPKVKTLTQGLENLMSSNLVAPILNLIGFTQTCDSCCRVGSGWIYADLGDKF